WAAPLGGVWDACRAALAGVRQLVAGPHGHVYWPVRDTTPMRVAALNLELFGFLVLFVVLTVLVWRRFGAAYGLFCAVSLAIPLAYAGRASGGRPPKDYLYTWAAAASGVAQYAVLLVLLALIAYGVPRRQLGIRRPRSWARAAGLSLAIFVAVFVVGALLNPV